MQKQLQLLRKRFTIIVNVVADYYFCKFELDNMQLIGNLLRYICNVGFINKVIFTLVKNVEINEN